MPTTLIGDMVFLVLATFVLAVPLGRMLYFSKLIYRVYNLSELNIIRRTVVIDMLLQILLCALCVTVLPHPIFFALAMTALVLGLAILYKVWSILRTVYCSSCRDEEESETRRGLLSRLLRRRWPSKD